MKITQNNTEISTDIVLEQSGLTPIQQQALVNLCQSKSIEHAARMTGVTSRTIHNWLNDPLFLSELNIIQSNMWNEVNLRLSGIQTKVLDRLEILLNSPDEIVSLKSADLLTNFLLRFYELSQLNTKLAQIERSISNGD